VGPAKQCKVRWGLLVISNCLGLFKKFHFFASG